MLNELKDELEYCRRKWALAREKNNESQSQWNDLRSEFSRRKLEDASNSGESGYSDEPVSDDDNSDDESVKAKKKQAMTSTELAPSTKKLLRVHSVSPIRSDTSKKRDSSAPPISTFLTEVFQVTSEMVPANLTQASVVTKPVENLNLNYAARTSVVKPKIATKITVKNVTYERPSTSKSGVKPKSVDEIRPRLSRELRKKETKVKEKRKGEETLEEMFFRLSGQEPPEPEATASHEDDDEDHYDEIEDIEDVKTDERILLEHDVINLTPQLVADETPNPEDISSMILSEEDEERRVRRAARFQRLEEQCQQLITQVINNSTRGDELNLHLDKVQRRFTPLRENSKSVDKSDEEGATGSSSEMVSRDNVECLTPREQEYTSRRAERLKRLEEECKEFLNKQNKSKIRVNEMSNKLDKLHQRYGSQESSEKWENNQAALTDEEDADKRAERLKTLEEQSAELLERMAQSSSRAKSIEHSVDALHSNFEEKESSEICTDSQLEDECKVEDEIIDVLDVDIAQDDISLLLQSNPDDLHSCPIEMLGQIENGDDRDEEAVSVIMNEIIEDRSIEILDHIVVENEADEDEEASPSMNDAI